MSKIIKDAMVLFVITLIAGFSLGLVYDITLPAIEAQKLKTQTEAYRTVYGEAKDFGTDETLVEQAAKATTEVLVPNGYEKIEIKEAFTALDDAGNKIGYVMTVVTQNGYAGEIKISLGYGLDGVVKGMEVVEMQESAGLGDRAKDDSFKSQFKNKKVDKFEYTKTGATADNQIDALSGATITTAAVMDAVNSGILFITDMVEAGNTLGGE